MRNPRNEPLRVPDTGGDAGPDDGPERRCILCGRSGARDELVRLAISPTATCCPTPSPGRPGAARGSASARPSSAAALANGKLKAALSRAFKGAKLSIADDLPALTENALRKAFLERLGLEMRAGRLILGSDRIAGDARAGQVAALYHAADASEDGSRKLDQAWRVGQDAEGSGLSGLRLPLDRAALSVALGRDNVVHLALADAKSAERVAAPLKRLLTFLGAETATDGCGERGAIAARDAAMN